jgi:5-formyltetrahydrofolate cyclo-ligase
MSKNEQRRLLRQRLAAMSDTQRAAASEQIVRRVVALDSFRAAQCVALYAALPKEPQTRSIFLQVAHRVVFPRVVGERMAFYQVRAWEELVPGAFGILEPDPQCCVPVTAAEIDFVLVPGVGFDRERMRLGRGGGFYDRFLEELRPGVPRVGVFFACQELDRIASEAHDRKLDVILTENETL